MGDCGFYYNGVGFQVYCMVCLIWGVDMFFSDDGMVIIEFFDKGFNNFIVGFVGFGVFFGVVVQCCFDEVGFCFSSE